MQARRQGSRLNNRSVFTNYGVFSFFVGRFFFHLHPSHAAQTADDLRQRVKALEQQLAAEQGAAQRREAELKEG
jgi:hypothetical protein